MSVRECGAKGDGVTDDAPAINACIAEASSVSFPCGIYGLSQTIDARDKTAFRMSGGGNCSILKPLIGWNPTANVMDISGSTAFEISRLQFDGVNTSAFTSVAMSAIIGDGTAANKVYGHGTIHHITLTNWTQQGIGIGANGANTLTDLRMFRNVLNMQGKAVAGNAIDTGGTGTKTNIGITKNRIFYSTQPAASTNGCVGIFTGHGSDYGITVAGNVITNPCGTGITVFTRPLFGEATLFQGGMIRDNVIRNACSTGIAIYGGSSVTVAKNRIYNPGQGCEKESVRDCIYVSHGVSGNSNLYGAKDIRVLANTCVDDQPNPTMMFGIEFVNDAEFAAEANVGKNIIRGARNLDYHLVNSGNTVVICCQSTKKTAVKPPSR